MKAKALLSFLLALTIFNMSGDDSQTAKINLQHKPHHGDHNNLPVPADEPDVYHNITAQEIIIDGPGVVSYYDVEISSATNWYIYVSTQVSGSYDTIDISSLPQGEYVITIDSSTGNSFEGYFETY